MTDFLPRPSLLSFRSVLVPFLFGVTTLVVGFSSFLLFQTTDLIVRDDGARAFLEKIRSVPLEPWKTSAFSFALLFALGAVTLFRRRDHDDRFQLVLSFVDVSICVAIISLLDFSYRGVIFIAVVNALRFFVSRRMRLGVAAACILVYILMDYNLLSLWFPVFSFNDYTDYYRDSERALYYGARNLLTSINDIVFIIYLVLEIQNWIEENTQIRGLNQKLFETTEDLRLANVRLEEYATRSEESARIRERDRLAREIHDIVAHSLTGIEVGLKACLDVFSVHPEKARTLLEKILLLAQSGVEDMRRAVYSIKNLPEIQTVFQDSLAQLIERIEAITGTSIVWSVDGPPQELSPLAEEALYRTAQEGLTNSVRHGEAKHIQVELRFNEATVEMAVRDDGKGASQLAEGIGLKSMRERAEALGGHLFWASRPQGFLVQISLPLRAFGGAS